MPPVRLHGTVTPPPLPPDRVTVTLKITGRLAPSVTVYEPALKRNTPAGSLSLIVRNTSSGWLSAVPGLGSFSRSWTVRPGSVTALFVSGSVNVFDVWPTPKVSTPVTGV